MMLFRSQFLRNKIIEFNAIHLELLQLKKKMERAYNLIRNKNMLDGKKAIIDASNEYSTTFDEISRIKEMI